MDYIKTFKYNIKNRRITKNFLRAFVFLLSSLSYYFQRNTMANYIFLMTLDNNTLTEWDENTMVKMTITGCGLSFVGNMLTLCLLLFLPIVSDSMFILTNMSMSLVGAQLAFIGAENTYPTKGMCKTATAILHYLFLCVHFTSLTFGVHLISKLRPQNMFDKTVRKIWIVLFCWGAPAFIVGLTTIVRGDTYATTKLCWLSIEHGTRWAFLGPVITIQMVNGGIFLVVLAMRFNIDGKKELPILQKFKHQLTTAISLIPVLGLTWSIGLATTFGHHKAFQYMFVILTATQGMQIFLGYVITNKQVRKLLCAKMQPDGCEKESLSSDEGSEEFTHTSVMEHGDKMSKRGSTDSNMSDGRRLSDIQMGNLLQVPAGAQCRHRVPRHST